LNQTFIAKSMDRNKSTISRELSRNTGKRGYRHKQANRLADERHQEKNKVIALDIKYGTRLPLVSIGHYVQCEANIHVQHSKRT
jgi:IS30 family transposase